MKKICEQVVLYFYDELDSKQRDAFAAHMASCPECQKEFAFLTRMQEALVPPAAPQAVVERVLQRPQPVPFWHRFYKPVLGGVCVLLLGVYAWFQFPLKAVDANTTDWVAYVSVEADEEYQNFMTEFEAFEAEFE